MTVRGVAAAGVAFAIVLGACTDDGGGDPGLDRIDGPAQVDEQRLEDQTPDGGSLRGG